MEKIDLTKTHKAYYTAKTRPEVVHIEAANFISIAGKGDPSGSEFKERIEALYSTTYALKFAFKATNQDFVVAKLEGLWWFDETRFPNKTIKTASTDVPRNEWEFRLLIRLPEFVTSKDVNDAARAVLAKKGIQLTKEVEFYSMHEGLCVQMLHVGPYSTEPETLAIMGEFMDDNRHGKNGLHHEIYLSDFRKTKPEKLKTILREPVFVMT